MIRIYPSFPTASVCDIDRISTTLFPISHLQVKTNDREYPPLSDSPSYEAK